MTQQSKGGPEVLFGREPVYQGWDDYYREEGTDAAWGEESPTYVASALAPHLKGVLSIADFGSGDGRNSVALAKAGHRLTLVDISPTGLRRATQRFKALAPLSLATMVLGSLEDLPLGAEQFSLGLCIDALPQVRRPRLALEEMHRTLNIDGVLVLNVFTTADCAFGEGEQVGPRSFLYKNTLFNFFGDEDFRPLLKGLFDVVELRHVSWEDPPHIPFRPYPHTHDGLVYTLKKL